MAEGRASSSGREISVAVRSKRRDLVELAIAYGLILLVIWTPRPWQKLLWWVAAAAVVIIASISFDGLKAMGLRRENFLRSLWVVGVALLVAAVAIFVAVKLHTLRLPGPPATGLGRWGGLPHGGPIAFIENYWAYALWAAVQQFLLQCFFLLRLLRLLPNAKSAAAMAAVIFAVAHLPSPILTPVTLIWGFAACLLFLRYRNLYPLAMAHAILGISIAITIPGPVDHNMRVGLGYLTYGHTHKPAPLPQP
jgi:membrane protease YdiL (CAAX protease family)